jgi:aminoglycoside phosphotransferase (APT) family kinase protein
MKEQTKIPPAPLSREELRCVAARVQDALIVLEETNFPSALGHLDFNPGNIIAPLTGCVFLDWAEAFVGHPFLTFEYLREHFRGTFGQNHSEEEDLVACYSSPWRTSVTERQISWAFEVAPLAAVFACAAVSDLWTNPDSGQASYLRSLTRRMHREASKLSERSALCPR